LLVSPSADPANVQKHAVVVAELTRIFANDKVWYKLIEDNKQFAKVFQLDSLILCPDPAIHRIGVRMGSLIMARVKNIEFVDVVTHEESKSSITFAIIKYIVDLSFFMRDRLDDEVNELHDRADEFEEFILESHDKLKHSIMVVNERVA
jgi:hypothetical protein